MSGHSKWAQIKRQKGAADAKRSTTFTKLANAITVAAREGGGDPGANFKLRLAIDQARSANMPKENIERSIKRGTGELAEAALETALYEAYGPGGVAILIEMATDNRNRALAAIKSVLTKHGGKLAESGAVRYLFKPQGIMTAQGGSPEIDEAAIIESGAEDYQDNGDGTWLVSTTAQETGAVARALESAGLTVGDIALTQGPQTTVTIEDEKTAHQLIALIEELEALDDVSHVASNFALDPTLEAAAKEG